MTKPIVVASILLAACGPVTWDLSKHPRNTMQGELPPPAEATEVEAIDLMIAAYQHDYPQRAVRTLYPIETAYRLVRHELSGEVVRRTAVVMVGFEEAGVCELQQVLMSQEHGPDGWGRPWIRLPENSAGVAQQLYRDVPCDQLD